MKRFIDLGWQIYCDDFFPEEECVRTFAFFDTVRGWFENFNGGEQFDSWDDFLLFYDGDELERYKRLCPEWVFGATKKSAGGTI